MKVLWAQGPACISRHICTPRLRAAFVWRFRLPLLCHWFAPSFARVKSPRCDNVMSSTYKLSPWISNAYIFKCLSPNLSDRDPLKQLEDDVQITHQCRAERILDMATISSRHRAQHSHASVVCQ
ncbi:unnamed protein product [Protopolystoma xenopodis]|uniref:Uncharacterized protein n=1 Tax=Protopolystoma xenopodis TaxID=117903 RepID=A0A448WBJ1_9PLAT|nr:unnamed protein product [Protopolystoma xenopodis]